MSKEGIFFSKDYQYKWDPPYSGVIQSGLTYNQRRYPLTVEFEGWEKVITYNVNAAGTLGSGVAKYYKYDD